MLGEPGDVVMMHPWLAHGIGMNTTESPRLAVYVLETCCTLYTCLCSEALAGGRHPSYIRVFKHLFIADVNFPCDIDDVKVRPCSC